MTGTNVSVDGAQVPSSWCGPVSESTHGAGVLPVVVTVVHAGAADNSAAGWGRAISQICCEFAPWNVTVAVTAASGGGPVTRPETGETVIRSSSMFTALTGSALWPEKLASVLLAGPTETL